MYGERRDASDGDVARWLERVSARLRELEAENVQLKQQLADLRRGVGIAVMIDGRLVPLVPPAQTEQPWQPPVTSSQPQPAWPAPMGPSPHTAPVPAQAATPPVPPGAALRHTFGPLASTPDELPALSGLLPAPRQSTRDWLGSGASWPDSPQAFQRRRLARTSGPAAPASVSDVFPPGGTYPPARRAPVSAPPDSQRAPRPDERNPYADSFIL